MISAPTEVRAGGVRQAAWGSHFPEDKPWHSDSFPEADPRLPGDTEGTAPNQIVSSLFTPLSSLNVPRYSNQG